MLRVFPIMAAALFATITVTAQNVVTNWNTIASTAIVTNGGTSPGRLGRLVRLRQYCHV